MQMYAFISENKNPLADYVSKFQYLFTLFWFIGGYCLYLNRNLAEFNPKCPMYDPLRVLRLLGNHKDRICPIGLDQS